jgi:MFS transporter, OFA family, oxalate/formate antiporter
VLLFAIQAGVFFMLPRAPSYSVFLALCCAALLCYGGGFGTMPAFVTDYFGARHVGTIYGLMLTAWGAGAVLGPMLVSHLREVTGDYVGGLQAIAAIMAASSLAPLLVRPPPVRDFSTTDISRTLVLARLPSRSRVLPVERGADA